MLQLGYEHETHLIFWHIAISEPKMLLLRLSCIEVLIIALELLHTLKQIPAGRISMCRTRSLLCELWPFLQPRKSVWMLSGQLRPRHRRVVVRQRWHSSLRCQRRSRMQGEGIRAGLVFPTDGREVVVHCGCTLLDLRVVLVTVLKIWELCVLLLILSHLWRR